MQPDIHSNLVVAHHPLAREAAITIAKELVNSSLLGCSSGWVTSRLVGQELRLVARVALFRSTKAC